MKGGGFAPHVEVVFYFLLHVLGLCSAIRVSFATTPWGKYSEKAGGEGGGGETVPKLRDRGKKHTGWGCSLGKV